MAKSIATNRILTVTKLINLQNALKACGVETELVKNEYGDIILEGFLSNGVNENKEYFHFYGEKAFNYEINHEVMPTTDLQEIAEEVKKWDNFLEND